MVVELMRRRLAGSHQGEPQLQTIGVAYNNYIQIKSAEHKLLDAKI